MFAIRNDDPYKNNFTSLPKDLRDNILQGDKYDGAIIKNPGGSMETRYYPKKKDSDLNSTFMVSTTFRSFEKALKEHAVSKGVHVKICQKQSTIDLDGNIKCIDEHSKDHGVTNAHYEILVCADGARSTCREKLFPKLKLIPLDAHGIDRYDAFGFNAVINRAHVPKSIKDHLASLTDSATPLWPGGQHRYRSFITRKGDIYIGIALTQAEYKQYHILNNGTLSGTDPASNALWREIKAHLAYYRILVTQADFDSIDEARPYFRLSFYPIRVKYAPKDSIAHEKIFHGHPKLVALLGDTNFQAHYFTNAGLNYAIYIVNILVASLAKITNNRTTVTSATWAPVISAANGEHAFFITKVLDAQKSVIAALNPYNPPRLTRSRDLVGEDLQKKKKMPACFTSLASDTTLAIMYNSTVSPVPSTTNFEADSLLGSSRAVQCVGSLSKGRIEALRRCNYHVELLDRLTKGQLEWLNGFCAINYLYGLMQYDRYDPVRAMDVIEKLSPAKIKGFDALACRRIWNLLPEFAGIGKMSQIHPNCLLNAFTGKSVLKLENLKYLPIDFLRTKGKDVLALLDTKAPARSRIIPEFSLDQFKEILKIKNVGKMIHSGVLCYLSEDRAKLIDSTIFSHLVELNSLKCPDSKEIESIAHMSDDLLTNIRHDNVPSEAVFASISAKQLGKLTKCHDIPIEKIDESAISGLPHECLTSYLAPKTKGSVTLGQSFWNNVTPSPFVKMLHDKPALLEKFAITDLALASPAIFKVIFESDEGCKHLHPDLKIPDADDGKDSFYKISKKCFDLLPGRLQAEMFKLAKDFPPDLLSDVTAAKAKNWATDDLQGIQVLELIQSPEVLKNLGAGIKTSGQHPCRLVDSSEIYASLSTILAKTNSSCLNALHVVLTADDPNYRRQPLKKWAKIDDPEFYANLTQEELAQITNPTNDPSGTFCAEIAKESFEKIRTEALAGLGPTCIARLPFKKDIGDKERIHALGDDAFSETKSTDQMSGFELSLLTPEQLGQASSKISNDSESIVTLINAEMMSRLSPDHLAAMTLKQYKVIQPSAFSKLSAEQLQAIPDEAKGKLSKEQIGKIPKQAAEDANLSDLFSQFGGSANFLNKAKEWQLQSGTFAILMAMLFAVIA